MLVYGYIIAWINANGEKKWEVMRNEKFVCEFLLILHDGGVDLDLATVIKIDGLGVTGSTFLREYESDDSDKPA